MITPERAGRKVRGAPNPIPCYSFSMLNDSGLRVRDPDVARFARWTIVANMFVILWGALVRATGSGAGCGNHWPLCNGVVLPPSPTLHTIIELTHRLTSGAALLLVIGLVVFTRRRFAPGHAVRGGALVTLVVMLVEAGIGAGLVKFELVADNDSIERVITLGAHLVNTMLLLAALGWTLWHADGHPTPSFRVLGARSWLFAIGLIALVGVGITGAIASLGDTLFPVATLAEGLAQDRDPAAHVLLRLRVWHPTLAVVTGTGLIALAIATTRWRADEGTARAARALIGMVVLQWSLGVATLLLLVPVPLQLAHLAAADLLWLAALWMTASALSGQSGRTSVATSRAASGSNAVPAPSSR